MEGREGWKIGLQVVFKQPVLERPSEGGQKRPLS